MIYDLTETIRDFLKKIKCRHLEEIEEDVIDDLCESTYPELDGLHLYSRSVYGFDEDYIMLLVSNRNDERVYSLNIHDNSLEIKEDFDNRNKFYLKYDLIDDTVNELVYTSDGDIVKLKNEGRTSEISIYTNAASTSLERENGIPNDLYPDYFTKVTMDKNGNYIPDDENLFTSNKGTFYLRKTEDFNELIRYRLVSEKVRNEYYRVYPHFNKQKRY